MGTGHKIIERDQMEFCVDEHSSLFDLRVGSTAPKEYDSDAEVRNLSTHDLLMIAARLVNIASYHTGDLEFKAAYRVAFGRQADEPPWTSGGVQ